MKTYEELIEDVNAFDYESVKEGARAEVLAAINAWRETGKPNTPQCADVILCPYKTEDGKLSFSAFTYEAYKPDMIEFKEGAESLDEVTECELTQLESEEPDDEDKPFDELGEVCVFGTYYIHTNIDFDK